MKPDRTNYEIWFIDYLDGNLDNSAKSQLFSFLEENPDLKEEFNELSPYILEPPAGTFSKKALLKRSYSDLSESQFDYLSVAAAEGDLPGSQAEELEEAMAKDPEKRIRFELIGKLKLAPPALQYNFKHKLKKLTLTARIIRFSTVGVSAAASLLLIVSILNRQPAPGQDTIAQAPETENMSVQASEPGTEMIASQSEAEETRAETTVTNDIIAVLPDVTPPEVRSVIPEGSETGLKTESLIAVNADLSGINYIPEVKLYKNNFEPSLVAVNTSLPSLLTEYEAPGINDFIARVFREKILKTDNPKNGELKAYEIADAGIIGLNKLFGLNMSLEENFDDTGEVTSVYFNSRLIKFNAPVKKDEAGQ